MATTDKWTDKYYAVYNKELERLRHYWPGIPEQRLQFWAEQVANKRFHINP